MPSSPSWKKCSAELIGEDIDLATRLDPKLGHVHADPGQLEQVIINLVVNAHDAMPIGGHLTTETKNVQLDEPYTQEHMQVQPGHYVLLAVSDTGCGMDKATQARIFEPFFTTKEVGKGTGLGLATVYGIVKQSGGSIEVYSEVNKGTVFKIHLPRITAVVAGTAPTAEPLQTPGGAETILLVEDEEGVRELACLALQSAGYNVLTARDGVEALRLGEEHQGPIHLLVTDVVMPRMGGRSLADRIASLERVSKCCPPR
jgi:two-component system cell cycle sensor histidine kinase/response regulator CckA